MKQQVTILKCSNPGVTDFYLNIIQKMFRNADYLVTEELVSASELHGTKNDIIVVSSCTTFFRLYILGYRKLIYWMQGIEAEESFLKHSSKTRKFVLDTMTKTAVKKAKGIFYVSKAMRRFIDDKFKINTENKSFLMPCFNCTLQENAFRRDGKYSKNIFAYVGSLSKWQCFDQTVDFFKKVRSVVPDAQLRIYTEEKEKAKEILEKKQITEYELLFVPSDALAASLSDVKFGFVLRDDIPINNVATPTKLSSYMSAGVIPVFSECINDFNQYSKKLKYCVSVENDFVVPQSLIDMCKNEVDANDIWCEYKKVFNTYFSADYYISSGSYWLKSLF